MTKEQKRIYNATPRQQAKRKAYRETPEARAKQKVYEAARKRKGPSKRRGSRDTPERRAQRKGYRATPRGRAALAACDARRITKRLGIPGRFTGAQFLALCIAYGNLCLCCRKKRRLTPDHVIPLSKHGSNYISNIQPLCRPCNSKKHDKTTDYR